MSRLQSRAQREAAFVKLATELHAQLEAWYDRHSAASFGEIEQEAPDYFRSRQKQRQYDQFRAKGWPIGNGVVESAANTVVHHRLKRPGRGWKRDYAQAMLAALCELHSHRFEQVWQA